MITKNDCIDIFNNMIRGNPVSFKDKLLPIVSEYLTEIKYENSDKVINLIVKNPQMVQRFIPELVEFYRRKYNILGLQVESNLNSINLNLKTILYYE